MASIAAISPDESGVLANSGMTATAVGGDVVPIVQDGASYVFLFRNDHSSGIDITMVGQASGVSLPGYGKMSKSSTTKTAAANGGLVAFKLTKNEISPFLNGSGQVAFTYASHNVALKLVALKV